MFTLKVIFSISIVLIAGVLLYSNKKTKVKLGTNMFQGKVKTKSSIKLLLLAVLALVALSGVLGAVKSGINDGTLFSIGVCFYICCLLYMEHNNFIISRSGVMYNNITVSWDSVDSYEWNDNKLKIVFRVPNRLTHGVVTVDNNQKREIDRILKKYMKKAEKNN
ncbi:DUF5673 domain-containing protein [Oceanirhabdus sp. W0125-5]|uniref:DUF5673 domain-containing protein n=1 Tax=Oceanirhabdus sp. W0125-5 TaxID=2999116 RepID=UPI0022F319CA|nr:DUF5673 domain-containing protein [Oceanirhabdus sp. W0125-5]WBW96525.1 DUF5673 domain-containing protein [Oceanirhabdus sp. W0125-5]